MKNIDLWKMKICKEIMQMDAEDLYEVAIDYLYHDGGLCQHCLKIYGECPENHNERICKERFKDWCEKSSKTKYKIRCPKCGYEKSYEWEIEEPERPVMIGHHGWKCERCGERSDVIAEVIRR